MRASLTPALRSMRGMRPSFLRSTSVTHTPVQPALPVRPDLQAYHWGLVRNGVQGQHRCAISSCAQRQG